MALTRLIRFSRTHHKHSVGKHTFACANATIPALRCLPQAARLSRSIVEQKRNGVSIKHDGDDNRSRNQSHSNDPTNTAHVKRNHQRKQRRSLDIARTNDRQRTQVAPRLQLSSGQTAVCCMKRMSQSMNNRERESQKNTSTGKQQTPAQRAQEKRSKGDEY